MNYTIRKKIVLGTLASILLIGLAIAVLNAGSYIKERDSYIEVGGGKIVYVPRTAQYVKLNGQIKKVVKFASTLSNAEKDCNCPNCCNGSCYVIVFSDSIPGGNQILPLFVLWVSCT